MKKNILFGLTFLFGFGIFLSAQPWSERFAKSEMNRHPRVYDDWDYVTGVVLKGMEMVWQKSGDKTYYDYIKNTVDDVVGDDGKIKGYRLKEYNIDEVTEGRSILLLYKETGEEKYKIAAQSLREQLKTHPRTTENGFWHKEIYPNQMWLDGLYMGSPFYAEYGKIFNEPAAFDDVINQIMLIKKHLYDPQTGLFFHAWDESKKQFWADKETGLSKCFWGRGLGWYIMAMVDVLDYLPENHPGRDSVVLIIQGLAEALKTYQDKETGLWWQVLDQGKREGNFFEASASSMFVYGLAKAVRMNYIDKKYLETARKGFDGITSLLIFRDVIGNYNLSRICKSAGLGGTYPDKIRDGSFNYYAYIEPIVPNDGKGTGPFLMAAVEIEMAEGK